MNFSAEEWERKLSGLTRARERLQAHRALPREEKDPELLNEAIWQVWRLGEYAMNALLEAQGERADRGHQMNRVAAEFARLGLLKHDYSERLEQLERYRRRADYSDYSRERSVHFTARNVEDCVEALEQLAGEVSVVLREKGWLA